MMTKKLFAWFSYVLLFYLLLIPAITDWSPEFLKEGIARNWLLALVLCIGGLGRDVSVKYVLRLPVAVVVGSAILYGHTYFAYEVMQYSPRAETPMLMIVSALLYMLLASGIATYSVRHLTKFAAFTPL